jgi:hypothetical protein
MRVWSIYGRSKRVLYFLSVLFFACETTTLVIALKASIQMIRTLTLFYPGEATGSNEAMIFTASIQPLPIANVCFAVIPRFFSFVWAPNLVLELVVFIMMIVKATEHTKAKVVTPILSALYRDGGSLVCAVFTTTSDRSTLVFQVFCTSLYASVLDPLTSMYSNALHTDHRR